MRRRIGSFSGGASPADEGAAGSAGAACSGSGGAVWPFFFFGFLGLDLRSSREQSMGESVSAMYPEMHTVPANVKENWRNSSPVCPVISPRGRYTIARVMVVAKMATVISRVLTTAAPRGGRPSSTCRKVFSTTTIASSTTSPMASTMARRVIRLMLKPMMSMNPSAPMSDRGIVTTGMRTGRQEKRKSAITIITSATACQIVVTTSSMDSWMKSVSS